MEKYIRPTTEEIKMNFYNDILAASPTSTDIVDSPEMGWDL